MTQRTMNLDLTTGSNDGSSWVNAFQTFAKIHDGGVTAGDEIYVKGIAGQNGDPTARIDIDAPSDTVPTYVYGVKAATTNEPGSIVVGDLIPGILTGSTVAYAQSGGGNDPPLIENTGSTGTWDLNRYWIFYGLRFTNGHFINISNDNNSRIEFFECELIWGTTSTTQVLGFGGTSRRGHILFEDCKWTPGNSSTSGLAPQSNKHYMEVYNLLWNPTDTGLTTLVSSNGGNGFNGLWHGCDFSAGLSLTNLYGNNKGVSKPLMVIGCKGPSGINVMSPVIGGGEGTGGYSDSFGPDPGSPIAPGESSQLGEWKEYNGEITQETTAVRTGGANDGASGAFSWAMVPHASETLPYFQALVSPWITGWIEGDGNNKTLTVYFAHDGTGDHDNDEVVIECLYPSEDGNIIGARKTTKINLFATPSTIATDASTWGGSAANNGQKLTLTIAPNYSGTIMVRLLFMPGTTETLFVDIKLDIT